MASYIWYRTIQIAREETHCRHYMGYSFRLAARVLLYASSPKQDNIPRPLLNQSWSTGWNEKESEKEYRSDVLQYHILSVFRPNRIARAHTQLGRNRILGTVNRKEFLFNDTLNTFCLRLYGVGHMLKNHSENQRGNPLLPFYGIFFSMSNNCSFICTMTFVALAGGIDPTTHCTMSGRSATELHLAPTWHSTTSTYCHV